MSGIAAILAFGAGTLGVTATPPTSSAGGNTAPFNTPAVTAIPSGGSGSYTYAWTIIIDPGGLTINSPAAATTNFTYALMGDGDAPLATVRCTVTDTVTAQTQSVDVDVEYIYISKYLQDRTKL